MRLAYKGTNYHGWQTQTADPGEESLPSVQGTILRVLRKIARYQECKISGTSRTDAGVHAQGQVGKVTLPTEIAEHALQQGMNSMLPDSIRVLECTRCHEGFNPKIGAVSKEYHYYFSSNPIANPLISDVVAHIPGPLDTNVLQSAAEVFLGRHDFYSFCRRSANAVTTVRNIHELELLSPVQGVLTDDVHILRIVGDGFLKQMVRYMVSALFEVGRGNIAQDQLTEHLDSCSEKKLAPKAPAHGLHLVKVNGI